MREANEFVGGIESTLPKPWEEEPSFHDALYDWMGRAPWLAISFAFHLLLYFVIAAIPWQELQEEQTTEFTATVLTPPEEIFQEPEEVIIEEIEEQVVEDPVITETLVDVADAVDSEEHESLSESPFEYDSFITAIGLGPGAGNGPPGKQGGRVGGIRRVDPAVAKSILQGLEWLAEHQSEDGRWSAAAFPLECDLGGPPAHGAGSPAHDVGVTGLALLAFLGFGDTAHQGQYKDVIRRGLAWLRTQQDRDTGQIGARSSKEWIYDHAIATLALAEAQYGARSPLQRRALERAVGLLVEAKAPYGGAWRYDVPNPGTADTSVTGWAVFALAAAHDAGVALDDTLLVDALTLFDDVTDGRGWTGYTTLGEGSSRPRHLTEAYPASQTRALTAVSVLGRLFIGSALELDYPDVSGERSVGTDLIELGAEALTAEGLLPHWPDDLLPDAYGLQEEYVGSGGLDMYAWYYGTYALYQLSDRYPSAWRSWERALERAVLPSQRTSPPCYEGSWDPLGAWGGEGGRVYSTALMVLSLQVYFRYSKVLGAR
ncbi:MAG: prenyltransferase/squalene oxidase repeat-containing protein [Planctomycetota bacterium]